MKLRYLWLILFVFLFPIHTYADRPVLPSHAPLLAEEEKKEGKNEYFEYQLRIPRFSGLKNEVFQTKLNEYYSTKMMMFKRKLEKEAKQYYDENKGALSVHPYVASTDYKITYNRKPLLSLYTSYYQYTGGAHGMYEWRANTFDIDLEKELMLTEMFTGTGYEQMIRQEIVKQIQQNKDSFFPDATEKINKISELKFFLEAENLVVYFPLYELAPYSSGIPEFRIPYTLLQEQLKDKYQKILIDK
ncbi:DUF3298 and DUF4163 domain-containing protein [Ectobacillus sp. JY-23]|uniref:DUF3298 and DUF4163 domain-containing protein n=1 Tax=Ectobacillus sp. JY-23 TaxID=2933872 RepID=UPI0034A087FC